jgi:hypothetical protein
MEIVNPAAKKIQNKIYKKQSSQIALKSNQKHDIDNLVNNLENLHPRAYRR